LGYRRGRRTDVAIGRVVEVLVAPWGINGSSARVTLGDLGDLGDLGPAPELVFRGRFRRILSRTGRPEEQPEEQKNQEDSDP